VEGLRKDTLVHELAPISEVEFKPLSEPTEARSAEPAIDWIADMQLVWEERQLLLRTAVWALVISTAIAFLIPGRYDSTASIMPPDPMNGSSGAMMAMLAGKTSPGLAAMAGNMLGMKNTGALFVDLLRSRTVQDHLVDRFQLQKVYSVRYKQDTRTVLDDRTSIVEDRKSGVITLKVRDASAQRSHDMAQAYVEELNKLVSEVSTSSARRQRIFIEQRMASVKSDLDDAAKQFGAFASKNTALDIKEQAKAMVEAGAILQGQLIAAQSELEGLLQVYAEGNIRVRAARARIDELKRQLEKMGGTDASLSSDAPSSGELYPSIRKLPLLGVQWADLYRRMKIQETVYELLSQQYELARIEEAKEIPTVNVIDPANLPEKKSWPPRLLIIGLLTVLSLAGAVAWIVGSQKILSLEHDDPRRQLAITATEGLSQLRSRVVTHRFFHRSNGSHGHPQ
jgi:capsule polysaccharide export protein KpsE/RkpR